MHISENYVISCGALTLPPALIFHDEPAERYEADLKNYFVSTHKYLTLRLKKFGNLSRPWSATEEKELFSLLQTLADIREMIRLQRKD